MQEHEAERSRPFSAQRLSAGPTSKSNSSGHVQQFTVAVCLAPPVLLPAERQ